VALRQKLQDFYGLTCDPSHNIAKHISAHNYGTIQEI